MPIDTRMNAIIHASLRRDLDRASLLLDEPTQLPPERLQLLGTHVMWLMDLLHDHHTTEDSRLFPVVRDHDPEAGPLLDAMDAEHQAISDAASALHRAGRRAEAAEPGAANAIRTAIIELRAVLDPHFEHEERALPPVVARCVPVRSGARSRRATSRARSRPSWPSRGTGSSTTSTRPTPRS